MDIDFDLVLSHFTHLGVAFLLALPVAFNRELNHKGAGLRTFPLVAIASCAFILVGIDIFDHPDAQARIMYGVIGGMGFIGGGAIVKHGGKVGGTATAAGLWNTGAIGVSVAYSRYEIALTLSLIAFLIFQFSGVVKKPVHERNGKQDDDAPTPSPQPAPQAREC
ncbi:MgtC/SapB family protein [Simiduia sp. 21SJ11W-1]|uniref:MgtC/SapB family protein n=1 Tax=Simiduia sp. 21SJ11W-1 TaxID=2909669 RepID=UPI00209FC317|nr:MgtC/SapB family protein [Simiduia sp. 21SJ11W-1]UTA48509.1 MgtC/SapB family protein [Simiduia sp. 21SJ11W-1]